MVHCLQGPALPPLSTQHFDEQLRQELQHSMSEEWMDVQNCAHVLGSTFHEPVLGPDCALPCTAVKPTLPDGQGRVGFEETTIDWNDMTKNDAVALQKTLMARETSSNSWRGMSVSVPCAPG